MPTPLSPETTVFVVDRDPVTRDAVCRLVTEMGLPYKAFASGQEFFDAYDADPLGCLVAEIRLPDISGLQIQQRLAAMESPLPIVFLTAHGSVRIVVSAMKAGAFHFLQKPMNEQELWDVIQEAIGESRSRSETRARNLAIQQRVAGLTQEERQVLSLLAEHDSLREIAPILDVSLRTVELRRQKLMDKLGATSLVQLLRFAFLASAQSTEANELLAMFPKDLV